MNITVIGTGYVGLVSGTCFSEMGNAVTCVDINQNKINQLQQGIIPIYEPGLEVLVKENIQACRLQFTSSLIKAMRNSSIFIIAVGTPGKLDGSVNMDYISAVAREIGEHMGKESVIVNKSTVPVGTSQLVENIISEELVKRDKKIPFHMVSNPEFMKEGDAMQDFMHPDRVIIGTDSEYALEIMQQIYAPFIMSHDRLIHMGIKEAELTKYAANAMLATKISFINEIAYICDKLDIDVESIRKGIGSDSRIGYSFMYPGTGYGGSCFPKDVKAILHTAKTAGVDTLVLEAVEKRNEHQKGRIIQYIKNKIGNNFKEKIFTVWGLSFKPGTDDMREAPSINIISSIIESGGLVQAFDPIANEEAARQFPQEWVQEKKLVFYDDNYKALKNAYALILMTEWNMFRNPSISKMKQLMENHYIFDGRNQYDPEYMKENGFIYKGIGR